jgi:hypothetical protein
MPDAAPTTTLLVLAVALALTAGALAWSMATCGGRGCPLPAAAAAAAPAPAPAPLFPAGPYTPAHAPQHAQDPVVARDRRVLLDPLYPPLNRSTRPVAAAHQELVEQRVWQVPTRPGTGDTYRLLGYYVNVNDKRDSWKLFGRQVDPRGNGLATFYVVPSDRTIDLKIPFDRTSDLVSPRLRDLYDLPPQIHFRHPLFDPDTPYQLVEFKMPTGDGNDAPPYF